MKKNIRIFQFILLFGGLVLGCGTATNVKAAKRAVKITTIKSGTSISAGTNRSLRVKTNTKATMTYQSSVKRSAVIKKGRIYALKPGMVKITITAKPKSKKYKKTSKTISVKCLPATIWREIDLGDNKKGKYWFSFEYHHDRYYTKDTAFIKIYGPKGRTGMSGFEYQFADNTGFKNAKVYKTTEAFWKFDIPEEVGTYKKDEQRMTKWYYVRVRGYAKIGKTYYYGKWTSYPAWQDTKYQNEFQVTEPKGTVQNENGEMILTSSRVPGADGYRFEVATDDMFLRNTYYFETYKNYAIDMDTGKKLEYLEKVGDNGCKVNIPMINEYSGRHAELLNPFKVGRTYYVRCQAAKKDSDGYYSYSLWGKTLKTTLSSIVKMASPVEVKAATKCKHRWVQKTKKIYITDQVGWNELVLDQEAKIELLETFACGYDGMQLIVEAEHGIDPEYHTLGLFMYGHASNTWGPTWYAKYYSSKTHMVYNKRVGHSKNVKAYKCKKCGKWK